MELEVTIVRREVKDAGRIWAKFYELIRKKGKEVRNGAGAVQEEEGDQLLGHCTRERTHQEDR